MPSRRKDITIEDLVKKSHVFMVTMKSLHHYPFGEVTSGELTDRQHKTRTLKEAGVLG